MTAPHSPRNRVPGEDRYAISSKDWQNNRCRYAVLDTGNDPFRADAPAVFETDSLREAIQMRDKLNEAAVP